MPMLLALLLPEADDTGQRAVDQIPEIIVMFGAAMGLLAAFYLVDHTRESRLPMVEAVTAHIKTV